MLTSRPPPELVELYLRARPPPGSCSRGRRVLTRRDRQGPAMGTRPRRHACRGACRTRGRARRQLRGIAPGPCTSKRQTFFETARTHLAYGSHLRRARQRIQAREQTAGRHRPSSTNLGAEPWSENGTQAKLAATGETARPGETRRPSTSSPLRNCRSRSGLPRAGPPGKPPRRYSSARKTIEHHLHNIYRKLAISSRRELNRGK